MSRARAENPTFSVTLKRIDLDRGERAVLRDVNWRVQSGQRWLLVGGNGAGKTQLLKLLAGSVWPKPTGRELRRYRFRGEAFDTPAGVAEESRAPGMVSDVLADAQIDHPELAPVLAVATTLLDGVAVESDARAEAGSVLEILPPFAGG